MSGIGDELGDVGAAIQRAEDKTAQMQARAGAIDELIASGALDDVSAIGGGDDIARELDAMSSQADVEAELAALKGGSTPPRRDRGSRGRRRHPRGRAREADRGRAGLTPVARLGHPGEWVAWHALDSSATPGSPPG